MDDNVIFEEVDVDDEVEFEEVKKTKWQIFKEWIREHDDSILKGILSGIFGLAGIGLSILMNRKEYDSYLYTNDQEGNVYRVRAKEMKTVSKTKKNSYGTKERYE